MKERFNRLSPEEDERLAILLEECGEVIQVVGKIQRHGYERSDPTHPCSATNRTMLEKELGDIAVAMTMLMNHNDISEKRINRYAEQKSLSIGNYLHHTGYYSDD